MPVADPQLQLTDGFAMTFSRDSAEKFLDLTVAFCELF